ncbi:putative RNA-binding protein [Smittium culicis]|uniref:Putative RNA-binding protein n=2 Tax=Smittium culicis TaxID=133412 RepID=A0A1R1XKP0_9FUNG|nr:putative RNA-binding protein [Smittium culicis]
MDEKKLTKKQLKAAKFRSKDKSEVEPTDNQKIINKKSKRKSEKSEIADSAETDEKIIDQQIPKKQKTKCETVAPEIEQNEEETETNLDEAPKKQRYLVFIGNLSYDTTQEQVREFFKATRPISIRLITDKITKRPKGFGFMEFDSPVFLKKALQFHKMELNGRKINVEFTVGGGGNSDARKAKINDKRKNLESERFTASANKNSKSENGSTAEPEFNNGDSLASNQPKNNARKRGKRGARK